MYGTEQHLPHVFLHLTCGDSSTDCPNERSASCVSAQSGLTENQPPFFSPLRCSCPSPGAPATTIRTASSTPPPSDVTKKRPSSCASSTNLTSASKSPAKNSPTPKKSSPTISSPPKATTASAKTI